MTVASFHLVRERAGQAPLVMARLGADRWRLRGVPGLRFWRLLGTGDGTRTSRGADLRRSALFAVWDDDAALDAFLAGSPVAERWTRSEELWSVRLRALDGRGRWRGVDILDGLTAGLGTGPVAALTRADVHVRHWRTFGHAGGPVSDELQRVPGLLRVVALGEAPVGRQGTFSVWRSAQDLEAFAYRSPRHAEVVRRTRDEGWYGEELFARFEPYASTGTWAGADPLAT